MDKYEKHTTHTDALDTLGFIIGSQEKRDAIHLAVFPVQAKEKLQPGKHVALDEGRKAYFTPVGKGVGIVDPFLTEPVKTGEWFWLVIYPRQISSLRHVWEHPAFPQSGETNHGEQNQSEDKQASEAWLRSFVDRNDLPDFDKVVAACTGQPLKPIGDWDEDVYYHNDDEYITFQGIDAHCDVDAEFWKHMEIYTGFSVANSRITYLGCSC